MADTLAVIDMIDAIGANAGRIQAGTKRVAIYLTGRGIAWTNADIATLTRDDPQLQVLYRIDQSNDQHLDTLPVYIIKDIEPGASSIGTAIIQATTRMRRGLRTGFYFSRDDWDAVVAAIAAVPDLARWVDFWIADWNLDRTGAIGYMETDERIKAVQYENGPFFDRSVTRENWPAPLPSPFPASSLPKGTFRAQLEMDERKAWDVHGIKGDGVVLGGPNEFDMVKTGVNRSTGKWLKPVPLPLDPVKPAKPATMLLGRSIPVHPKVAAGASVAGALAAAQALLSAFGVHVALTQAEKDAIVGVLPFLPVIAAWLKQSTV